MRAAASVLAFLLTGPQASADDASKPPSRKNKQTVSAPEDQVKAIDEEYQAAVQAFNDGVRRATTPAAQKKALSKQPLPENYSARLMEIARNAPKQPAAFQSLRWVLQHRGGPKMDAAQTEAVGVLLSDHLAGPQLGHLCATLADSKCAAAEDLLRGVLAKSPSHETQGQACCALAYYLVATAGLADYFQFSDPRQQAVTASNPSGKAMLERMLKLDASALREEAKALATRMNMEFADVRPLSAGLADWIKGSAAGAASLPIGSLAPEIDGDNLDGERMKLSDYRGKVVVLVFWGDWCVHSRALVPQLRRLASAHVPDPFVLLGVNNDVDIAALKKAMAKNGITWPSWRDRGGKAGVISQQCKIPSWPFVLVIDHKGVIRYKTADEKGLNDAVNKLIREVPFEKKAP